MKKSKKPDCAYLYPDGHAILLFREREPRSGQEIEYAEAIERIGPKRGLCLFQGRVVIRDTALLRLIRDSVCIKSYLIRLDLSTRRRRRAVLGNNSRRNRLAKIHHDRKHDQIREVA